jgi:hypothetical protein
MPRFGVHVRELNSAARTAAPINWRRGLSRVWLLASAAWIMGWIVYLILYGIQGGFRSGELLAMPVLLLGPPVALLLFGLMAGWAFRGFKPD